MSTFSRDEFIASMTKELERQVSVTGNLAQIPALGPAEVLRKLYYDFPVISGSDVLMLVAAMEEAMNAPDGFDRVRLPLTISRKLLENLAYLNDRQAAAADPVLAEATGKLCAFIYLRLPAFLLNSDIATLRGIFSAPPAALLPEVGGEEGGPESEEHGVADCKLEDTDAQLSWMEVWQEYAAFLQSCSASVLCPARGVGGVWFQDLLRSQPYVASVETCVATLGALVAGFDGNSGGTLSAQASSEAALQRRFFERCESASPAVRRLTLLQNLQEQAARRKGAVIISKPASATDVDSSANESAADVQLQGLRTSLRKVWLHFMFVCRDVVAHCPPLLESWLPALLGAITRTSSATADFPSDQECLRVVVCANISSALNAQQLQHMGQGADAATAAARPVRALARAAFRTLLDSSAVNSLGALVDICQRMRRGSADGGVDAACFLLDLAELYVDGLDARGAGLQLPHLLTRMHAKLVESRSLAVLAELFDEASAPDAPPGLRSVVPRMLEVLAVAALQVPATACYIIRLPVIMRTLPTFLPTKPGVTQASVQPAELLPLLIGLLQASAAPLNGGSAIGPPAAAVMDAVATTLYALTRETTTQITAALQAQSLAVDDVAAEEEAEQKDPEGESQRRKARVVPGLSRALQLLTLPQAGGKAALQKFATTESQKDTAAALRGLALQAAKMSVGDIKRNAKIAQNFLEGNVAHKMD